MNRILNLRTTPVPVVKIVEKVVMKPSVWWQESLKFAAIVLIVSSIVYAISYADNSTKRPTRFNAFAVVSSLDAVSLSVIDATSTDNTGNTVYNFDTTSLTKIEDVNYTPLTLSDFKTGDKIAVQGIINDDGTISITRLIYMDTFVPSLSSIVSSSTDEVATTTQDVATSTEQSSGSSLDVISDASSTTTDAISTEVSSSTVDVTPVIEVVNPGPTPEEITPDAPADVPAEPINL